MVWLIVFAVTIPEILRVEIIKKTALISIRVFFHGYNSRNDSQNSRGRKGTIFYSTLPLPPAHEHPDIYLQLCMWDDYDLFLFATLVFTRLLLDKFYHLIELLFNMSCNFLFVYLLFLGFRYSNLTWEAGGLELASTIAIVLQANRRRLTSCW